MAEILPVIAVVGPTASGKTEIGMRLARHIDSEIISVDSMQIYRWMDIGTAKPTPEMRREIPHHLIDILNPNQSYSAGRFAEDADAIIERLAMEKKVPILLGGTNLYFKSLINGIIAVPNISDTVRAEVRTMAAKNGVDSCYKLLRQKDPQSAEKLHPNDISRISRALEVVLETGKSIQSFQENHQFRDNRYRVFYIGPWWSREELYDRINRRVYQMVDDGLIDEAENLLWRGYSSELPSMRSIGYKQAVAYLNDDINLDEMIADIQQKSRHYAKKQLTWAKRNPDINWLKDGDLSKETIEKVNKFISSPPSIS